MSEILSFIERVQFFILGIFAALMAMRLSVIKDIDAATSVVILTMAAALTVRLVLQRRVGVRTSAN